MAHTPKQGAWYLIANSWQYTTIYSADDVPICRLDLEDWGVTEDNQSNLETEQALFASLISAAPDMLAALKSAEIAAMELCIDQHPDNQCWVVLAEIRAAIAKAEGRNALARDGGTK